MSPSFLIPRQPTFLPTTQEDRNGWKPVPPENSANSNTPPHDWRQQRRAEERMYGEKKVRGRKEEVREVIAFFGGGKAVIVGAAARMVK